VVEAAPDVAAILAACPGVRLLVTSRERLKLRGEHDVPLLPLSVPEQVPATKGNWTVETALRSDAVRLFLERAQASWPDFDLTPDNAAAVAEICARLDGLPLAIELAAARVRVLPPGALLRRMERRLPLLTGGSRDLPERQRTLRDTIAWSYDLLDPTEQALYRRLSVFVGGCTLDTAEAVSPSSSVLDSIAALVDGSLARQTEQADGEPRFTMLETIREFGLERLAASGDEDATPKRSLPWPKRPSRTCKGRRRPPGSTASTESTTTFAPPCAGSKARATSNPRCTSPERSTSSGSCAAT
jgi:predicted ATPase